MITLDSVVQPLLLLVLQCELLALLLDVLLQGLELLAHDAVLALEPQARLRQRHASQAVGRGRLIACTQVL